jgi:hypothetical protein
MQSSERVGQTFHWVRRVHQTATFEVWDGQSSTGQPAIMVLLTPGAINDHVARASFVDAVRWAQRPDITEVTLLAEDAIGVKPWAALAADPHGQAFAERLLGLPPSVPPAAAPVAPPGSPVASPWSPSAPSIQPAAAPVHGGPTPQPFVPGPVPPPSAAQQPTAPWGQVPDTAQSPPASTNPAPLWWGPEQTVPAPQPWDGQSQPVRSPDIPPLPGPQDFAERRRRRSRTRLRMGLIVGAVLVLAAAAATAAFVLPGRAKDTGTGPTASASPSPSPSPSPTPRPTFQESAAPVAVLGSTWQPGEATKVQDFAGWPFAFRTPSDATCEFFVGQSDYKAHNCKWGTEPNHTVMAFVVRRCVNSCDANEQAQFETMTPWKPDGALAATDATTKFVNVDYGDGREQFTMVHYFGTTAGGPPQWVVIVQGNTAKQMRDPVLKTINDVRSQTP